MSTHRRIRTVTVLVGIALWFAPGCSTGFIQEAAQSSLASFAIEIFSTVVNDIANP